MKRRSMVVVLGCVLAIGCGKDKPAGGAGSATGGSTGEPTATATPATGACKPISMCEAFPAAHVDAICGAHIAKPENQHVDSVIITDECAYMNADKTRAVALGRLCVTPDFGGADKAKQLFDLQRVDIQKNAHLTDMPGVGDQAYYRGLSDNNKYPTLYVRKGNLLIEVSASVTAETEDAIKTKCLVALYNELAAKS